MTRKLRRIAGFHPDKGEKARRFREAKRLAKQFGVSPAFVHRLFAERGGVAPSVQQLEAWQKRAEELEEQKRAAKEAPRLVRA